MKLMKQFTIPILVIILLFLSYAWILLVDLPEEKASHDQLYHIAVIGNSSADPTWNSVLESIQDAALTLPVAIENHAPRYSNIEEMLDYLDMAVLAKVDGIIVQGNDDPAFLALVNQAEGLGIPVVTVINDSPESLRRAFVGSNNYAIGEAQGKMLAAILQMGKVAIVRNDFTNTSKENTASHAQLNGALSALNNLEDISVEGNYITTIGGRSVNEVFDEIMEKGMDGILVLDAQNTLDISKLIVQQNLVGKIDVVGFGGFDSIIAAIDNEILQGTIDSNADEIGKNAIVHMVELLQGEHPSTYVDTGIIKWNKEAIEARKLRNERID